MHNYYNRYVRVTKCITHPSLVGHEFLGTWIGDRHNPDDPYPDIEALPIDWRDWHVWLVRDGVGIAVPVTNRGNLEIENLPRFFDRVNNELFPGDLVYYRGYRIVVTALELEDDYRSTWHEFQNGYGHRFRLKGLDIDDCDSRRFSKIISQSDVLQTEHDGEPVRQVISDIIRQKAMDDIAKAQQKKKV